MSNKQKMLIVPVVDKEENLSIKYEDLCNVISSYGIFINKINLHPKSPYDNSEDTFGMIK